MYGTTSIEEKKAAAKRQYKEKRAAYLENPSKENWIAFCEAKRACMLMGCII